jgi:hypothetical protein
MVCARGGIVGVDAREPAISPALCAYAEHATGAIMLAHSIGVAGQNHG